MAISGNWPAVACMAMVLTACQTVSRTEPVQLASVKNDFEQFNGLAEIARNVRKNAPYHLKRGKAGDKLELCGFAVLYGAQGTIPRQDILSCARR